MALPGIGAVPLLGLGAKAVIENVTWLGSYADVSSDTHYDVDHWDIGPASGDRWVVIATGQRPGIAPSSVTVNGYSLTNIKGAGVSNAHTVLWLGNVPTGSGACNIDIVYPSNADHSPMGIWTLTKDGEVEVVDTAAAVTGSASSISTSIALAEGGALFAALYLQNWSWTNWNGTLVPDRDFDTKEGSDTMHVGHTYPVSADPAYTVIAAGGNNDKAMSLISLA